jgi:hypothetical protein
LYWASLGGDRINRRHVIIAAVLDAPQSIHSKKWSAMLVRGGLENDQVSNQEFKLKLLPDIAKFFIFALELL